LIYHNQAQSQKSAIGFVKGSLVERYFPGLASEEHTQRLKTPGCIHL